jgi:hypothetical protein
MKVYPVRSHECQNNKLNDLRTFVLDKIEPGNECEGEVLRIPAEPGKPGCMNKLLIPTQPYGNNGLVRVNRLDY